MQHFLKPDTGTAGTWVVAAKFLDQFLVAMNHPVSAFDLRLGREALLTLADDLESRTGRRVFCWYA